MLSALKMKFVITGLYLGTSEAAAFCYLPLPITAQELELLTQFLVFTHEKPQ